MNNHRNNFIFSLDGDQKSFYITNIEVAQFCRLIRSVFNTEKQITALMDAQGNICELSYFCENISSHKDRFYIILTDKLKSKRSPKKQKTNDISLEEPPKEQYQILDFQQFVLDLQYMKFCTNYPLLTVVLIFDNLATANIFGQSLAMRLNKEYPYLQAFYTVIPDDENDSLLLTIFENQNLKKEVELKLGSSLVEDIGYHVENLEDMDYQSRVVTPEVQERQFIPDTHTRQHLQQTTAFTHDNQTANPIPLIVTRGDQRQVLQVEANDNFHSSQGKRTHGVMRVKKALEKVRDRLSDREYDYLLNLIVNQDQAVFATYQLYQKLQSDDNFIQNLKALVIEENNLSFNDQQQRMISQSSPNRSDFQQSVQFAFESAPTPNLRSPDALIDQILQSKLLDIAEQGMLRDLRLDSATLDILSQMNSLPNEMIISVLKPYLQNKFNILLQDTFTEAQIAQIHNDRLDKLSPIYFGFLNFQNQGGSQELISLIQENYANQQSTRTFQIQPRQQSYSFYLQQNNSTQFELKMMTGEENRQEVQTFDITQLQMMQEYLIDKFHTKILQKYSTQEYDKLFNSIIDQCTFFDEQEKAKVTDFYHQENQRLFEIIDKYGQNYDINKIKSELSDLVMLQNQTYDAIASPTNSQQIEPKMQKLKNFKFLIHYFQEIDKVFSVKQIKTFLYLYATENISTLAAYEVYCETKDQEEFIQTLSLIYKIYQMDGLLDEIESFDELTEQQLNILFAYRRFLSISQREALEKNLQRGDTELLRIFREFLRNKDYKGFTQKVQKLADDKYDELIKNEAQQIDYRERRDQIRMHYRDLINSLVNQFLKNKVKYIDMLLEAVDKDNIAIKSAFEIYDQTGDKQDMVENIELIYKHLYQQNVRSILKALIIELQRPKTDLTYLLKKLDQEEAIMKGAFELYFSTRDEAELKDTISRILRFNV